MKHGTGKFTYEDGKHMREVGMKISKKGAHKCEN